MLLQIYPVSHGARRLSCNPVLLQVAVLLSVYLSKHPRGGPAQD